MVKQWLYDIILLEMVSNNYAVNHEKSLDNVQHGDIKFTVRKKLSVHKFHSKAENLAQVFFLYKKITLV